MSHDVKEEPYFIMINADFGCGLPMRGSRTQSSHRSHPRRVSLKSIQFLSVTTAPHTHPALHLLVVVRQQSGEKISVGCIHVGQESVSILVSVIILGETVPIRIRHRGSRSKDAFVEDQLIIFVGRLGAKFVLFGFADNFTCLMTQHFIIELRHSLHIERVSLDFTLRLIIIAPVPIVFGPTQTNFHNVLIGV